MSAHGRGELSIPSNADLSDVVRGVLLRNSAAAPSMTVILTLRSFHAFGQEGFWPDVTSAGMERDLFPSSVRRLYFSTIKARIFFFLTAVCPSNTFLVREVPFSKTSYSIVPSFTLCHAMSLSSTEPVRSKPTSRSAALARSGSPKSKKCEPSGRPSTDGFPASAVEDSAMRNPSVRAGGAHAETAILLPGRRTR